MTLSSMRLRTAAARRCPGWRSGSSIPTPASRLPPDDEGEVAVPRPGPFDGYYKDPELNAECIDAEGWFHTGTSA